MKYAYPTYGLDVTPDLMDLVKNHAVRLMHEVGFRVPHAAFLSALAGKAGIRIDGERVHFDPALSRRYLQAFIDGTLPAQPGRRIESQKPKDWTVRTAGYSMMVLDLATEAVRPATCQDLRDMIKLANSCDVGGDYPVMPQDVPPLLRTLACYKICWEMSQNIAPYDYQNIEQTPFLYEMYQVMGRNFEVRLTVPTTMTIDPHDIDIFLRFYPLWKRDHAVDFSCGDYGMIGLTKPITIPGCAMMMLAEKLSVHILFNLFDPDIHVPLYTSGGHAVDLRHSCWAYGSPRQHLFAFLNSLLKPRMAGREVEQYRPFSVTLETSSAAIDEQAALEKMAHGLMGAMQGARLFDYAGVLCVDDLFSGTQFIIDLEIVNYIREMTESFNAHPDILNAEGMYEECRDVSLGLTTYIEHPHTLERFRNIVPSSDRIVREKLRSWMEHHKTLKDRARDEAIERIRRFEPYRLPADQQRALDQIYARAEAQFSRG